MPNKTERCGRACIDGWVAVWVVASDCSHKARNRVKAIERMSESCMSDYELWCPNMLHLKTHTIVGWRTGPGARLRAEGASVIVRERKVGTACRRQDER
jgi:hypothetical protein